MMNRTASIAASLALFFFGASAHALTVDTSTLDTMHTESHGPFGILNWSGVALKINNPATGNASAQLDVKPNVRVETGTWLSLRQPENAALSRIVKASDGSLTLEHAELTIDSAVPTLQVTSLSSVRLTEVARLDPKIERSKSIPIYAYRSDASHIVVVVGTDGSSIGKRGADVEGSCAQGGRSCTFDTPQWNDHMVTLTLGLDSPVAQARGDVTYEEAPKGETNPSRTYIVNASFTKSSRDPAPILAITMRTMETIFRGEMDGE
jgi:hypothetical protein